MCIRDRPSPIVAKSKPSGSNQTATIGLTPPPMHGVGMTPPPMKTSGAVPPKTGTSRTTRNTGRQKNTGISQVAVIGETMVDAGEYRTIQTTVIKYLKDSDKGLALSLIHILHMHCLCVHQSLQTKNWHLSKLLLAVV